MTLAIGFDLGGTTMSAALVDAQGQLLSSHEIDTLSEQPVEQTLERMATLIEELLSEALAENQRVEGIGIGVPGLLNPDTGVVHTCPNLPQWKEVPLSEWMQTRLQGLPVRIDNDVRVAALGELNYGAGRGAQHMICMTIGTGIGGCVIINGQIHRGASFSAGELGHIHAVPLGGRLCACGSHGCLETVAGTQGILMHARRLIEREGAPLLAERMAEGEILTPKLIAEAAQAGDAGALQVWQEVGQWIGMALASLANLLNPERVVIGGGIAQVGAPLFDAIRATIMSRAFELPAQTLKVVSAELGPNAGMIGAAVLARQNGSKT